MIYILGKDEKLVSMVNKSDASPLTTTQGVQPFCYFDLVQNEELGGINTITVSVPADHEESQYFCEGNYIVFQDYDLIWQMYEITDGYVCHDDQGLIRVVNAEHFSYQYLDEVVEDKYQLNGDGTTCLGKATEGSDLQIDVVNVTGTASVHFYYESRMSALQKVRDAFDGDLKFSVLFLNGVVTAKKVSLYQAVGTVTNKQFRYTKDIKSIKKKFDARNVMTACYGRGKGVEVGVGATGDSTYGRRLDFADVVWTTPTNPANKPAGQEWVEDTAAKTAWGRNGKNRMGVYRDDEETDAASLLLKTWNYLQANKTPAVSYEMTVQDMERMIGYSHEAVRLGDTVVCVDEEFSPALMLQARVVKLKRDYINPDNMGVTIGNFVNRINDMFGDSEDALSKLSDRQGVWDRANTISEDGTVNTDKLQGLIDTFRNQISAAGGCVTITDTDGILVVDNKDNPTKAMKISYNGFGIANSKVAGAWVWKSFGTGDGFSADYFITGFLSATRIQGGILTLGGSSYGDGMLKIKNVSDVDMIAADKSGMIIKDGAVKVVNTAIAYNPDGSINWGAYTSYNLFKETGMQVTWASGLDGGTLKVTPGDGFNNTWVDGHKCVMNLDGVEVCDDVVDGFKLVRDMTGYTSFFTSSSGLKIGDYNTQSDIWATISKGNISLGKDGYWSKINFSAQTNDPGYIGHYENNNASEMRFCVSDDSAASDIFTWGAAPGGTFAECARLSSTGYLTLQSGLTCDAIELRVASGTPFIDFSNDGTVDYDMRLILMDDANLKVMGGFLDVSEGLKQDGNVILNGTDTWLRTHGSTGWYSETYGGGIFMQDTTWIRTFNNKKFYCDNRIRSEGYELLGKISAYSWNGTINNGVSANFTHNLGYKPIVNFSGTRGNIIMTIEHTDMNNFTVTCYSSGGSNFTGYIYAW